jgi:hypothetical protein
LALFELAGPSFAFSLQVPVLFLSREILLPLVP